MIPSSTDVIGSYNQYHFEGHSTVMKLLFSLFYINIVDAILFSGKLLK